MKILAMDVGKSKTVGYAVDTATGEAAFETVVTTPTVIRRWMQKRRPDRVVMEIGPLAGWIHDAVRAEGVREVQVANVNHEAWRWRNVRQKNDRLDAAKLADLSAAGQLPTVHMPTAAVRQWRQLIAYRSKVVDRRTAIKNSIRSILAAVGQTTPAALDGRRKQWSGCVARPGRGRAWERKTCGGASWGWNSGRWRPSRNRSTRSRRNWRRWVRPTLGWSGSRRFPGSALVWRS